MLRFGFFLTNRVLLHCSPATASSFDDAKSQRPKGQDGALSSLDVAIEALSPAKDISGVTLAKIAFDSVDTLTTIMVHFFQFCLLRQQVLGSHVTRTR